MTTGAAVGVIECVDVERELLSGLLIDGEALPLVLMERLIPGMFWLVRHEWIFEAMIALHNRGDDVDLVTVSDELHHMGRLDEVNGDDNYLMKITAFRKNTYNFRTLAAMVRRTAERRQLEATGTEIVNLARDKSQAGITAWSRAKRALDAARPYEPNQNFTFGADTFEVYRQMLEDMQENRVAYELPFKAMRDAYGQEQPGDMLGIVGPTGSGKSAVLGDIAEYHAEKLGLRTALVFTEMQLKKVLDRRMAKFSKIDYRRLKSPVELNAGEHQMLLSAEAKIAAWSHKLDYWHAPAPDGATLLANMRRMNEELGTTVFVVDHMNDVDVTAYSDMGAQAWKQFLTELEVFCNESGSILWTAAQTNRNDGKAYMVGQAFDQKMSLVMELQPQELKHDFSFEFDGRDYFYRTGKNSPIVPIHFRKNREGGPARGELLFVGPRYLWIDVPDGFSDGSDDPGAYDHVFRGSVD